ncbi:MAG TPA: polysaccharide deacetylase family protein [Solirubrobacteraceae bacterium]|jgi:peptidoglycan/xylan/chitin deacetylase (PgdA/CDA1 family)|nr:polysaccharide deacetylase family protein [Solirubrobacteraceae bacterium]
MPTAIASQLLAERRSLALTFDDGPNEYWTPYVLGVLAQAGASGTFFMIGECLRAARAAAQAVLDAGGELQLHCDRHVRHSELSEAEIEADTLRALDSFAELGVRPTLWRTPWGICTEATERVAARHGLSLVHWTIDTHDWRGDSVATMLALARARFEHGGIVLMHDGIGPGSLRIGAQNTAELLLPLIAAARAEGLSVGSLAQCGSAEPAAVAASPAGLREAISLGGPV